MSEHIANRVAGIDPGIGGAIAFVGGVDLVFDMPVYTASKGNNQVNPYSLAEILRGGELSLVVIEKVGAMPGQGVVSMFNFGKTAGIIEGVCSALGLRIELVTPQKWKSRLGLIGKDKDYSRTLAIQKYPGMADQLSLKKHCGRADALHIAHYGLCLSP